MTSDITKVRLNDVGTIFRVRILEDTTPVILTACTDKHIILTKPDGTQVTKEADFFTDGSDGYIQYTSITGDINQTGLWNIQGFVEFVNQSWHTSIDSFLVQDGTETSVEYLLPMLRLRIGDINPASYRYMDDWLVLSLIASVRSLERYWDNKYHVTDGGVVSRDENYEYFTSEEADGVVQAMDEIIIVLKASLIVLEGSLENNAWNLGSWRDAEISYSNIASGNIRGDTIRKLQSELDAYLKSPMKRLTESYRMTILDTQY
jgi:hypothetical protein